MWVGGFVVYYYMCYFGDLFGGIFIGWVMVWCFGFEINGIGFYFFDDIVDFVVFKDVYCE